jgi:hypothetical protein
MEETAIAQADEGLVEGAGSDKVTVASNVMPICAGATCADLPTCTVHVSVHVHASEFSLGEYIRPPGWS